MSFYYPCNQIADKHVFEGDDVRCACGKIKRTLDVKDRNDKLFDLRREIKDEFVRQNVDKI